MSKIDVVIPFKNRDKERVLNCIKRLDNQLINKIIIVDYGSKEKISIDNEKVKIIYFDKNPIWNKAHAINLGIKASKSEYIMTLDVDILLSDKIFEDIKKNLNKDNFILSRNVRRINIESIDDSFQKMMEKSFPWRPNESWRDYVASTATGGVQIFPRDWIRKVRGIDENLFYFGGMDNITLYHAKKQDLNIIDLNEIILHQEHDNKKEFNLPKEEQDFARFVYSFRARYLNDTLVNKLQNNPEYWGHKEKANQPMLEEYKIMYKEHSKEDTKTLHLEQDINSKILIAIINNTGVVPTYFMKSVLEVFNFTKNIFPNTQIQFCTSCSINEMRNLAVSQAITGEFNYLVQLDTDHFYTRDFIIRLLAHNKDFVTGTTKQRVPPYYPTQYHKLKFPIKSEENMVFDRSGKLIEIEASGPVGMLIRVDKLRLIDYPQYVLNYECEGGYLSGDIEFCRKVKERGFKIYLDTSLDFPHQVDNFILSDNRLINKFDIFR